MSRKIKIVRLTVLLLALGVTIFICHASKRLVEAASENFDYFYTGEWNTSFSNLLSYAFYQWRGGAANSCLNNLRQIDGAKQQWALEKNKNADDNPTWEDLREYLGRGMPNYYPHCPHGGLYLIGRVGDPPRCTIREHNKLL